MSQFQLLIGDCLELLRQMPDNSVDSVVTDPPYGLSFMGKKWDYDVPAVDVWVECLRVLKPGGHLLAFAGTRTQHRMAVRIEDAGFEIRDMIAWVYGSGFPKSMDVSKAIDKSGAQSVAWFGPWLKRWREDRELSQKDLCERCGFFGKVNRGGTIANWELSLGQPTVEQFNRICDVLELPFESMSAAEREVIGTRKAAPGVAFSSEGPTELAITAPATDAARQWQGWGTALKPALEPITVARKPFKGTVANNVLAHGTGALNIDGCRIGAEGGGQNGRTTGALNREEWRQPAVAKSEGSVGRWPANLIHDGSAEVVAQFPQSDSARANGNPNHPKRGENHVASSYGKGDGKVTHDFRDTGSAARFFYCAKTSRKDRNEGFEGKLRLRRDLSPEQRAYVIEQLKASGVVL